MPANPTPAQSEASRANGARSQGPKSEEGKANIARAATRHGLFGAFRLLPGEDATAFAALRAGWVERLRPEGPAEAAAVERLVATIWREGRLAAVEDRLLRALAVGESTEGLPSLATLIRYKARLERERSRAEAELAQLRALAGAEGGAEGRSAAGAVAPAEEAPRAAQAPASPPSPAPAAAAKPSRAAAAAPRAPASFGLEAEFRAVLAEAERELARRRAAGAASSKPDPLQDLLPPAPGRDLRTSASAAALAAARLAAA